MQKLKKLIDIFPPEKLVKEDKSSSSATEALDEVKKRTKFSSPFAAARVKEKIPEGIKVLNSPQEISLLLMSYLSVSEGWR